MRREALRDRRSSGLPCHRCFQEFGGQAAFVTMVEGILLGKGSVHFFVHLSRLGSNLPES